MQYTTSRCSSFNKALPSELSDIVSKDIRIVSKLFFISPIADANLN